MLGEGEVEVENVLETTMSDQFHAWAVKKAFAIVSIEISLLSFVWSHAFNGGWLLPIVSFVLALAQYGKTTRNKNISITIDEIALALSVAALIDLCLFA